MKISECTEKMTNASKLFLEHLNKNQISIQGIGTKYEIYGESPEGDVEFKAFLIGTYVNAGAYFQFPYDPENPAIPDEDKAFYLTLKSFGERTGVHELTEMEVSFDPMAVVVSQAMRRMTPPQIHRNQHGQIESCLTLDDVVSLAARFYKASAFIALNFGDYSIYLAVMDDF